MKSRTDERRKVAEGDRRQAEFTAAEQTTLEGEKAAQRAAREEELAIAPSARLDLPAWGNALAEAGVDRTEIDIVLDGCVGEICGRGGSIGDPSSESRSIDIGVVVITQDRRMVYLYDVPLGTGPLTITRALDEIRELRQNNTGSECQIRFQNDRFFDGQPATMFQMDWWGLRMHRNPNIRAQFRDLGFPV